MTDPLSEWLDAMSAKARAATPGPWQAAIRGVYGPDNCVIMAADCGDPVIAERRQNAAYLAALPPETVRAMVDVVRAGIRCAERGYPCSHCDLGYDEDTCSCFDSIAEKKEHVAGLSDALAHLRRLVKGEA